MSKNKKPLTKFELQFRCGICNAKINRTIYEYKRPIEYKIRCHLCEKFVMSKVVKDLQTMEDL